MGQRVSCELKSELLVICVGTKDDEGSFRGYFDCNGDLSDSFDFPMQDGTEVNVKVRACNE